jgi:hypothetical protein
MNLCIDCKFSERGGWLDPLCRRPAPRPAADLVCAKERHGREVDACGQIGGFFEERQDREGTR